MDGGTLYIRTLMFFSYIPYDDVKEGTTTYPELRKREKILLNSAYFLIDFFLCVWAETSNQVFPIVNYISKNNYIIQWEHGNWPIKEIDL